MNIYKQKVGEDVKDSPGGPSGSEDEFKPELLPPLVLAYIGDACFELYVRERIVREGADLPPQKLHQLTTNYVKASSQSDMVHGIWDGLKEEERIMVKRGRNAKSGTIPKHADIIQYRYATGFETLIGYLFLKDDRRRLLDILDKSYTVQSRGK